MNEIRSKLSSIDSAVTW